MPAPKPRVVVLFHPDTISLLFSILPVLLVEREFRIHFTDSLAEAGRLTGASLLIVRYFKKNPLPAEKVAEVFDRLRERYGRIIYFDDGDGAGTLHTGILPHVDLYYKKQLLRDRSRYLAARYGGQLFSDHYHRSSGVHDRDVQTGGLATPADLAKLGILWNNLVGCYHLYAATARPLVGLSRLPFVAALMRSLVVRSYRPATWWQSPSLPRNGLVHARFTAGAYRASIGEQRRRLQAAITTRAGFLHGPVPRKHFRQELREVSAALSPFGWGEICFRDGEVIQAGAALIKPSMDHLQTWPDVYLPGETYYPLNWDLADLDAVCAEISGNKAKTQKIADNAQQLYKKELTRVCEKARSFLAELSDERDQAPYPSA